MTFLLLLSFFSKNKYMKIINIYILVFKYDYFIINFLLSLSFFAKK